MGVIFTFKSFGGSIVTLLDRWVEFLTEHEEVFYQIIGGKFRLLLVDPELEIVFFRDYDSDIQIDLGEGKHLPENSSSGIALREHRTVRRTVPKDVFGVEVQTHTIPFADRSGAINIVYNVETSIAISDALEQIVASTEEISSSTNTSVQNAFKLEEQLQGLSSSVSVVAEQTKKLTQIYEVVKDIAKRLQLISLNASIEAAHASEYGQGFAVVAQEVRKLADQTADQMDEVSSIIDNVEADTKKIEDEMGMFELFSKEQREAEQEISSSIETVLKSIHNLQNQTNELMRLDDK